VNGGVNDIAQIADVEDPVQVASARSTFLANWTNIFAAQAAAVPSRYLVALQIWPWTAGTNAEMLIRDDWNAALNDLAQSQPRVLCVNLDNVLGQNRPSGPPGNLWDLVPDYVGADGIHLTESGYAAAASALAEAEKAWLMAQHVIIA
jgi:lysophospholipase L1-like esterase